MKTKVVKATKTLEAIEAAILKDQGAKFREQLRFLLPKMEDAYRGAEPPFRGHLGASTIGRDCPRELWYSFNWATAKKLPEKLVRLFNRGHLEEARFLSMLMLVDGLELWYEDAQGGQFKISDCRGHFGSALDGVAKGVPDLPPDTACYTEFKTSADKGFKAIKKSGVRSSKFEHYAQMQVCMEKSQLSHGLYMVVNKNDDELYAEIIEFDKDTATKHLERAEFIINAKNAPQKISTSAGWFGCKFCDHNPVCQNYGVPEVNCRTCLHSSPADDKQWSCSRGFDDVINSFKKYHGCSSHVFNPELLQDAKVNGVSPEGFTDITLPSGERILQGPDNVTSLSLKKSGLGVTTA